MAYVRTVTASAGTYLREQTSGWWKLHVIVGPHEAIEVMIPPVFFDNYFERKETK